MKKEMTKKEMINLLKEREKQTREVYYFLQKVNGDEILIEKYKSIASELFWLLHEMGIEQDYD